MNTEVAQPGSHTVPASGIVKVVADPGISRTKLCGVAFARSVVLTTLLGGALAALVQLWGVSLGDPPTQSDMPAVLDFCAQPTPTISSQLIQGNDVDVLAQKELKIASFQPVGANAEELGLPKVGYYHSEESYATPRTWNLGLSLGSFRASEYQFQVTVQNLTQQKACIAALADKVLINNGNAAQDQLFGMAIVGLLKRANRRDPHEWLLTTPASHGALLVRLDSHELWSATRAGFDVPYTGSIAWRAYLMCFVFSAIALSATTIWLGGKFAHKTFLSSMDIWMEQYDYAWEHTADGYSAGPLMVKVSVGMSDRFQNQAQAASLFFIFDHLVGDPYANAEHLRYGLLSALIDGVTLVLLSVLPVLSGLFFPNMKWVAWPLVAIFAVCSTFDGWTYFFGVPWKYRCLPMYSQNVTTFIMVNFNVLYFCAFVVFMITRLVVDPEQVQGYAAAVGTVIMVSVVAVKRLSYFRQEVMDRMKGNSNRGQVIQTLRKLGLDLKSIIVTLVLLIVLTLSMSSLVLLVGGLYSGATDSSQLIGMIVTPVTGLIGTMQMLQQKQAFEEQTGQISDSILSVV